MKTTRIALLSTAHIHTQGYIRNLREGEEGRELVAIWDDNTDRGERFAREAEVPFAPDLDLILGDRSIDGFIICAENTRHFALLARAIPAGRPIFCEKPLVTREEDLGELERLLAAHSVPLICGYFWPLDGTLLRAREIAEGGQLGKVTNVRMRMAHAGEYLGWFDSPDLAWFAITSESGGGAMMDLGTHCVHLLRTYFGPVRRVFASIHSLGGKYPDIDDHAHIQLEFASGARGLVEASWVQTGGINGLEVIGSDGAVWNGGSKYLQKIGNGDAKPLEPLPNQPSRVGRLMQAIHGELTTEELRTEFETAADAVRIMSAAFRSAASGTWQEVSS